MSRPGDRNPGPPSTTAADPWAPAVSPAAPPAAPCELVTVDDALVTPLRKGSLRSTTPPRSWISGAVHDAEGRLVPASQRLWAGDRLAPVAADPDLVRVPPRAPELAGTWLYVGHWFSHFGHFLLETLTDLWPAPGAPAVTGLLGHRHFRGDVPPPGGGPGAAEPDLKPWQADLVARAGYGGLPVRVVRGRPVRVERLLVPERPVVLKSWARRPAVDVWQRVAATVRPGTDERVLLSRRLFHAAQQGNQRRVRVAEGRDEVLERLFAEAGFRVVHPETLPIAEQVSVVRGADVLAGPSGSALHLAVFARPGTRVLEVGDDRTEDEPMSTQRMVDAACGHRSAFVPSDGLATLPDLLARG